MLSNSATESVPPGFTLRYVLRGHENEIYRIAWSPDGKMLASPSSDRTVRLWDIETGQLFSSKRDPGTMYSVSWSPGRKILAFATANSIKLWNVDTEELNTITTANPVHSIIWSSDGKTIVGYWKSTIQLWDVKTGQALQKFIGHVATVRCVVCSPNGKILASGSEDTTIKLWEVETGTLLKTLSGHSNAVRSIVWSLDGRMLVSASDDMTIRLWGATDGLQKRTLEAHTDRVVCISYSFDGRLLASKSRDGTVRLWRTDIGKSVIALNEIGRHGTGLAFHPHEPILATFGEQDTVIRIWNLDFNIILGHNPSTSAKYYTNAKVVLVGDSGVGKSGLGLVLVGQPFTPTESTHGRRVWTFDSQEVEVDTTRIEKREILLWDLAGQPGYRLTHQLYLNEVTVALVVFDATSETDPFAAVYHWDRALRLAQRIKGNPSPLKKFLVAARIDRGGKSVSRTRINTLLRELNINDDDYFETSAKEGWGIGGLIETIKKVIDWEMLPKVSSTDLFTQIKNFLIMEKESGRLLATSHDLYRTFLSLKDAPTETEELYAQFETCIALVESRGLIWRLSFGNFILLQPELLDAYVSALVNAVKDEPDGLGSIAEDKVKVANFLISSNERLKDKEQEKLLLIAMVEDLLRHEIVLREQGSDGPYLVFPSQSTRENPDLPDPEGKAVIFEFEGPVLNVYATLAVRLSHSGFFIKKELWKNAITYTTTTKMSGTYGMFLLNHGEGRAELTLFFDKETSEEIRFYFEEYVYVHLQRRALSESLKRRRIFACNRCGAVVTDQIVQLRKKIGFNWLDCPVCNERVLLIDPEDQIVEVASSQVLEMDLAADNQRDLEANKSTIQGKKETKDFDVFLCHHSIDKPVVKKIGEQLKEQGLLPWLDEWELRPGIPWQTVLEEQIGQIKSAAVFVGKSGIRPWQLQELNAIDSN